MPLGTAPNDIFQNGQWYNRQGVAIGTVYKPISGNVPAGLPPSGTIAANGALTLGTALGRVFAAGIFLFFPAGAVFSGSAAGLYWTVMSSTTVGTVFNNVATPGTPPIIPSSPTAVVDAGPGAYATPTTGQNGLVSFTVPGGLLGPNGYLRYRHQFAYNLAAGNKTLAAVFGGSTLASIARSTTGGSESWTCRITNLGREDRNAVYLVSESSSLGTSQPTLISVDTSAAQSFSFNFTLDTATNYLILENIQLEVVYGS